MPQSNLIRRFTQRLGYDITRIRTFDSAMPQERITVLTQYAPWRLDQGFLAIYEVIREHTFLSLYHCWLLWVVVGQVSKLEGALIEVGVWQGASGSLIASRARQGGITDTVYLCDTFRGIVKTRPDERAFKDGALAMSRARVDHCIQKFQLDHVRVLEGIFPDETGKFVAEDKVRFCHIDVDVYQSAYDVFYWVWERMVVGGIIVFDDYTDPDTPGVIRFVDETRMRDDLVFVHNVAGQAIFVKVK